MLYDAILPILAATFFLVGVGALVLLMLNILRELRDDPRNRRLANAVKWRIDLKRAVVIVLAVGLIGAANVTFWVNGQLRLYSPVVPGIPLGTITIMQESGSLPRLVYSSIDREGREALEVFPVRDANFRLKGEVIRWSPALKYFGLGDHFKVSRIDFYPLSDTAGTNVTFGVNVRQGSSSLFQRIVWLHNWLPFVDVDTMETGVWNANGEYSRNIYLYSDRLVAK